MRNTILACLCLVAAIVLLANTPSQVPRESAINTGHDPLHPPYAGIQIKDITVGRRVIAQNPEVSDVDRATFSDEPNEVTYLKLTLSMIKQDGGQLAITLLRPLRWLDAVGAEPGATIYLDLPELGAQGDAEVLAVDLCPPIESRNPKLGVHHRIVTGTFSHTAGNMIDVQVDSMAEPLGTTANHPFWSEDRNAFVEAGDLHAGERLRLVSGDLTTVQAITNRGPPEPVYNLEVHGEHVYFVGADGVLVHNSYNRRRLNGQFAKKPGPKPKEKPHSDHGNYAGNQDAALYAKSDADGNFVKWGVTQDLATRYPKRSYVNSKGKFIEGMDNGRLSIIHRGTRREMIDMESYLVERIPGPRNLERHAGTISPEY